MKLVTYNIQYGVGMDGAFNLQRIADSIAGADILALQEVTRGFPRNGHVDLVSRMAGFFPAYYQSFGAACDILLHGGETDGRQGGQRFQFGNMILSRWPILAVRHLLLPRHRTFDKLNLQRGAVEAVIAAPSGPLRVYSVHLDHVSPDERIEQIRFLKERALNFVQEGGALTGAAEFGFPDPPLPDDFVMLGDFNMVPESPEYLEMVGRSDSYYRRVPRDGHAFDALAHLGTAKEGSHTWAKPPGEGPVRMHLDHCFVSPQLVPRLRSARIDHQAPGSDHFPVWIEID
ncbi:endonuclease [Pseudorhizobium endolithicum]|uniref:Endonuclease n=1 Tax=Pseudorhizobium endolithicum TaxID=1191678 RepID=A0ABM8PV88_9HYPH|nr:endonuclease/exonuclease/phosphatase family protein [Pseudorhizobium endolithicum]CAD7050202.1 endonuclease [Pseudorhizobium endolithicum]